MFVAVQLDQAVITPSTVQCTIQAASDVGVPPDLVLAVRSVEAGRAGFAVCNSNSTCDYGEAAINTAKFHEVVAMGFSPQQLVADGCYAMRVKASILRQHLMGNVQNENLLSRAARYHSKTPAMNRSYQIKLTPWLNAWACALATNYKLNPLSPFAYSPEALFVVSSGLMSKKLEGCSSLQVYPTQTK